MHTDFRLPQKTLRNPFSVGMCTRTVVVGAPTVGMFAPTVGMFASTVGMLTRTVGMLTRTVARIIYFLRIKNANYCWQRFSRCASAASYSSCSSNRRFNSFDWRFSSFDWRFSSFDWRFSSFDWRYDATNRRNVAFYCRYLATSWRSWCSN